MLVIALSGHNVTADVCIEMFYSASPAVGCNTSGLTYTTIHIRLYTNSFNFCI